MSADKSELPIKAYAQQIVETVKLNAITIVIGETGSGKTTQIPQVRIRLTAFPCENLLFALCYLVSLHAVHWVTKSFTTNNLKGQTDSMKCMILC